MVGMERKTILIIGGGVSGLSAGIYAEQSGFHAIILEKNPSVGGLCTGWYRKGQYIDGCIHWLTGTNKNTELYRLWKEVGAIENDNDIIQLDGWGVFNYHGVEVPFYADTFKAEQRWLEISPADKKEIKHFFKMVRDIASIDLPLDKPVSMMNLWTLLKFGFKVIDVWPSYLLTMKMSCERYAKRFKSPALRWAIKNAQPGAGNLYSMLFSYANITFGNGGIPRGGSKPMVERMKDRFLSLGGTLLLNQEVSHVLIEHSTAVGVELKDGKKIKSDYVVSALDSNYALHHLLLGQYNMPKLEKRFKEMKKHPAPSCCLLAFRGKKSDIPTPYSFECEPFYVGGTGIEHLTIRNYGYDEETYVKDDKCLYMVLIDQYSENYKYWSKLYKENPIAYREKKNALAMMVRGKILAKFPQFEGELEILDVCTPKTLNRYTNASRGTYMGFLFTKSAGRLTSNGFVKGLKNFIMAGQYMQCPGGLPLAMVSGRFAIQWIAKKEKLSALAISSKLSTHKN